MNNKNATQNNWFSAFIYSLAAPNQRAECTLTKWCYTFYNWYKIKIKIVPIWLSIRTWLKHTYAIDLHKQIITCMQHKILNKKIIELVIVWSVTLNCYTLIKCWLTFISLRSLRFVSERDNHFSGIQNELTVNILNRFSTHTWGRRVNTNAFEMVSDLTRRKQRLGFYCHEELPKY